MTEKLILTFALYLITSNGTKPIYFSFFLIRIPITTLSIINITIKNKPIISSPHFSIKPYPVFSQRRVAKFFITLKTNES